MLLCQVRCDPTMMRSKGVEGRKKKIEMTRPNRAALPDDSNPYKKKKNGSRQIHDRDDDKRLQKCSDGPRRLTRDRLLLGGFLIRVQVLVEDLPAFFGEEIDD